MFFTPILLVLDLTRASLKMPKKEMPKVSKLPKMPKVNVFYLFYKTRNSREVVILLFSFIGTPEASDDYL